MFKNGKQKTCCFCRNIIRIFIWWENNSMNMIWLFVEVIENRWKMIMSSKNPAQKMNSILWGYWYHKWWKKWWVWIWWGDFGDIMRPLKMKNAGIPSGMRNGFINIMAFFVPCNQPKVLPIYWPAKMIMIFPKKTGSFGIKRGSEPSTKMAWSCSRWEVLCGKKLFDLIGHLQSTTKEWLRFARCYWDRPYIYERKTHNHWASK